MRTKSPSHDDTRARILQVARALVLKHGHAGLSLRAVAREAGFSAPSLYEYFDSKQAIIDAVAAQAAGSLRHALEQDAEGAGGPRQALVALGAAYVAWARRHPQDFMLLFGRLASKRRSLAVTPGAASPYQRVLAAVHIAQAAGLLRGGAAMAESISYALWAAAHGMAMLQLTHLAGFEADFPTTDRAAFEALLAGFAPRE